MDEKKETFYFSASTGGFYHSDVHGDNMPEDAVEITAELHAAMLEGHYKSGKVIVADANGHPMLADRPAPSRDETLRMLRIRRDMLLKQSDWTQFGDSPLTEAQRTAWKVYRHKLRDLPSSSNVDFPEPPKGT